MTEGQLNHLSDLSHLLSASTNVIISNFVQVRFFVFSLERIAIAVDDGFLCYNAVLCWIDLNYFEFDGSTCATGYEGIAFADRSVGCKKERARSESIGDQ